MLNVYLKLLLTAFFWGGTFVAGRMIAGRISPSAVAFLRFAVASLVLFMLTWKIEGRLPSVRRRQVFPLFLLGMTGIFSYNLFFFKGLELISAGRAALIIALNPIFITICSGLFFRERLTLLKITGILVSVAGAIIVISRGSLGAILTEGIGWGEFYIFCCVLSWVTFSLIGKTILSGVTPLVSVTYSSAIGAVALFVPAYLDGMTAHWGGYTAVVWINIFYLGIFGTVVGFIWYYEGIKAIGPTKASLFINFVPISAIVLAFFILGEPVTRSLLFGGLLVSSGVYMTNMRRRELAAPAASSS
mgnify:CR=1 FL=1|jgi:drug/metabolite transporter (DMT)-like permease